MTSITFREIPIKHVPALTLVDVSGALVVVFIVVVALVVGGCVGGGFTATN